MLALAARAIDAVRGDRLVKLHAGSLPADPAFDVLAIGKAAPAMLEGAREALGERLCRALLIAPAGAWSAVGAPPDARIEALSGDHPLPGAASLAAGRRLLQWLESGRGPLLVLLSGGASSLVEVPVPGIDAATLRDINRWLLGSGLDIHAVNAVRQRLSRIKAGGLLARTGERPVRVWTISDVRGDDPAVIGSGPFWPRPPEQRGLPDLAAMPAPLREALAQAPGPAAPTRPAPEHRLLANLRSACEALVEAARQQGLSVCFHEPELEGDAAATGRRLVAELDAAAPGLHLWGGETTVRLPARAGRGGRNQQLALAAAIELAGREDWYLLALGTDGRDGPTDDAGALVDGGTVARGGREGLEAGAALAAADAGTFLAAGGDLVSTGPTGTNVRDIVLAWKPA